MLKKVIAGTALAAAATGAVAGIAAPTAVASDTSGRKTGSNINAVAHLCGNVKDLSTVQSATGELLDNAKKCNASTRAQDRPKAPLSDLANIGSFQS